MIEKGKITITKDNNKITVDTEKLILVSGDCFSNFFHPFIANILNGAG